MSFPTPSNPVGCTNSPPYAPEYYPPNAPLYRDPSGYCLPYNSRGQVVYYAQYGYNPGLGVGIAFLILFALLTFVHIFTTFKSRRIWLLVIPSASGLWTLADRLSRRRCSSRGDWQR